MTNIVSIVMLLQPPKRKFSKPSYVCHFYKYPWLLMCGSKLYGKGDLERERERYARVGLYYTYEWEDVTNYNQTSDM